MNKLIFFVVLIFAISCDSAERTRSAPDNNVSVDSVPDNHAKEFPDVFNDRLIDGDSGIYLITSTGAMPDIKKVYGFEAKSILKEEINCGSKKKFPVRNCDLPQGGVKKDVSLLIPSLILLKERSGNILT